MRLTLKAFTRLFTLEIHLLERPRARAEGEEKRQEIRDDPAEEDQETRKNRIARDAREDIRERRKRRGSQGREDLTEEKREETDR